MSDPRAVEVAKQLHLLQMSNAGIVNLLTSYPLEDIERQLSYLPYRPKVKRQAPFLIEAIRNNYSPPKEYFYAETPPPTPGYPPSLHEDPELPGRQAPPEPQGHRTPAPPDPAPGNDGIPERGQSRDLALPQVEEALGQGERSHLQGD
ncbi:MAG: hypothetical protein JST12_13135 [Armatimonadetes bacterium]|nr:hypothetical protein [Armatimonadota bacterium]